MKPCIRLRGINGQVDGKVWESDSLLRVGSLATLEIVLDDSSVSRRHAEVRATAQGWRVRDMGSANGTFLNGQRLGAGEWPVRPYAIIRFGNITVVVDMIRDEVAADDSGVNPDNPLVEDLRQHKELFIATINMLARAVELRDDYTGGHMARVTEYSLMLAERLDLSPEEMHWIRAGAPLHDIGKIGIDDAILRKPGKLTPAEFEIMKSHVTKGAKILEQVPDMQKVLPIVRSHHERWDGQGYPDGLKGEQIPRLARLVAVCNAFDAMTSDTPYRQGMPSDIAFAEIEKEAGKQFDPDIARAFLAIKARILEQMQGGTTKFGILTPAHSSTLRLAR